MNRVEAYAEAFQSRNAHVTVNFTGVILIK